ncbi:glutamate receptor -like [Olea europaea subsp. europaea]|uniref:Glutamate receptor n=1 Tax=Olea europaea subsp. europaea TaxID=158383 RepID=A0A8S0R0K5_OLEEU|nr:glutamate receptor -like [Olea europaea subsp. europaea]
MKLFLVLVLLAFFNGYGVSKSFSARPDVVSIGSVLSFDSIIGKVAKVAIEAAVEDVNTNSDVLRGTKLKLTLHDSNFTELLETTRVIRFMETETVAIIGPQFSITAHVVSYFANELHVPLLSFSSTDPTLSPPQFPFLVRTSPNDLFQMAAIADIINYYEWREVIAIYVDDDYGRNGIAALSDQLAARSCLISYKVPLKFGANLDEIRDALVRMALKETRVLVVHAYPDSGLDIFATAKYLGMMDVGYAWLATNWLSTLLDTYASVSSEATKNIQGVITLRMHIAESKLKKDFVSRWSNLTRREEIHASIGLNTYGLYAYDTVWLLAHAIDNFFEQGGNISFSSDPKLKELLGGAQNLNALSIFKGGNLLLDSILKVDMTGVTGLFRFTSDRNLIPSAFEVINVIGSGSRVVGYWNFSGLSVLPPNTLYTKRLDHSSSNKKLYPIIWPGQTTKKPRGWVFQHYGRHLKIGVPNRVSFMDFASYVPGTDMFSGYCIDIFTAAINLLEYALPHKLIPYGDGHNNPSGTELIRLITSGVFDAAVGDIAITTNRTRMADFTQPFVESGLVVVAPIKESHSSSWAFLQPFTCTMWVVMGVFFLFVGVVVWILEHRINGDFRGPPREQFITILWFSFSNLFVSRRGNIVGSLGRFVFILLLFVVLIIRSSYTASLTSILTVQQLSSPIKGIGSLLNSKDPIGYQQGSFARDYLVEELGIQESRLVPLKLPEDYVKALKDGPKNGGVVAVVDERAYAEVFLSTHCEFSIVGKDFTKYGWGFVSLKYLSFFPLIINCCILMFCMCFNQAFQRGSQLAVDMSTAILKLSENGELQRIHDKWLLKSACSLEGAKLNEDRPSVRSFLGLFLICGSACLFALLIYFVKMIREINWGGIALEVLAKMRRLIP